MGWTWYLLLVYWNMNVSTWSMYHQTKCEFSVLQYFFFKWVLKWGNWMKPWTKPVDKIIRCSQMTRCSQMIREGPRQSSSRILNCFSPLLAHKFTPTSLWKRGKNVSEKIIQNSSPDLSCPSSGMFSWIVYMCHNNVVFKYLCVKS